MSNMQTVHRRDVPETEAITEMLLARIDVFSKQLEETTDRLVVSERRRGAAISGLKQLRLMCEPSSCEPGYQPSCAYLREHIDEILQQIS